MVGSYVHGLGSFEAIFADESLCFHKHHRTLANLAGGGADEERSGYLKSTASSRNRRARDRGLRKRGKEHRTDEEEEDEEEQAEEEDEYGLSIEDEDEDDDNEAAGQIGGTNSKKSTKWPAKRVLNLRVKAILDLIDKVLRTEARERQRQERIKSKEDRKRIREDEREQRLQQRNQRQQIKRQRLEERRSQWSKRERGDFRVAIMAYGPGLLS